MSTIGWTDGTRAATGNTSMFAAGDKMGRNALTSGWRVSACTLVPKANVVCAGGF